MRDRWKKGDDPRAAPLHRDGPVVPFVFDDDATSSPAMCLESSRISLVIWRVNSCVLTVVTVLDAALFNALRPPNKLPTIVEDCARSSNSFCA